MLIVHEGEEWWTKSLYQIGGNVAWCSRRWSVLWGEVELNKGNICCRKAGEVVITLKRLVGVHLLEMNGRS